MSQSCFAQRVSKFMSPASPKKRSSVKFQLAFVAGVFAFFAIVVAANDFLDRRRPAVPISSSQPDVGPKVERSGCYVAGSAMAYVYSKNRAQVDAVGLRSSDVMSEGCLREGAKNGSLPNCEEDCRQGFRSSSLRYRRNQSATLASWAWKFLRFALTE